MRRPRYRTRSLTLIFLLLGSGSSFADDRVVRVRLFDGIRSIEVVDASGKKTRLSRSESKVRVNQGPADQVWRTRSRGPHRIIVSGAESSDSRGRGFAVRGKVVVRGTKSGLRVINLVPLENYVEGTLGAEMSPSWDREALRAQAVASRTYAIYQMEAHRHDPFDVTADVTSQVYGGVEAESPSVRNASRETRGEVLSFDGRPALAAFHSASGGRTASSQEVWGRPIPYLRSVEVDDEADSPDTYWRLFVDSETLAKALAGFGHRIGSVRNVEIRERSRSGRVLEIVFSGSRGRARISGRELRSALGESSLKSTIFEARAGNSGFAFVGTGRGHGVGMSQWAAQAMAQKGANYRDILRAFYPGTRLGHIDALRGIPEVSARGAKRPAATVGAHAQ